MKGKIRLDKFLSDAGLSESIEKAKGEIIAGWVKVNGETIRFPSSKIYGEEDITIARPGGNFASRGGLKLQKALRFFNISVQGKTAVDLGSSSGGFTDCLLKNGAIKVYAVDVGYGLLDHRLRTDPRVVIMERTNVRKLAASDFNDKIDFVAADLSFISILKVYEKIKELFYQSEGVILLKPQFEAERGTAHKGVVTKIDDHISILRCVIISLTEKGLAYKGLNYSPIKGPAGNIEFLLYFSNMNKSTVKNNDLVFYIEKIVHEAHEKLNNN